MNKKEENLKEIQKKLDEAIDLMDIQKIDELLNEIPEDNFNMSEVDSEAIKNFSQNIKSLNNSEGKNMKILKSKTFKITVAAAAIMALTGVGTIASGLIKNYNLSKDGKYYNIISTQDLNKNDLDGMIDTPDKNNENGELKVNASKEGENARQAEKEDFNFNSIEEAENKLGLKIILPQKMPNLELSDITGSMVDFGGGTKTNTVWANFGSIEDKLIGLTITKNIIALDDTTIISSGDMDEGSKDEYVSAKGYKFTTFNESNEDGSKTANIANINIGTYEYSVVFFNYSQNEMNSILDSIDLSEYK